MTAKLNPNICFFCQQDNHCNIDNASACWCNNVTIPAELIHLLPSEAVNQSCICNACIDQFIADKNTFIAPFLKHNK